MARAEPVGSDAYFQISIDTPGPAEHGNRDHVEHGRHDGGYRDSDQPSAEDVTGHRSIDAGQAGVQDRRWSRKCWPGQHSKTIEKRARWRV